MGVGAEDACALPGLLLLPSGTELPDSSIISRSCPAFIWHTNPGNIPLVSIQTQMFGELRFPYQALEQMWET